jgi:hypothetical protein
MFLCAAATWRLPDSPLVEITLHARQYFSDIGIPADDIETNAFLFLGKQDLQNRPEFAGIEIALEDLPLFGVFVIRRDMLIALISNAGVPAFPPTVGRIPENPHDDRATFERAENTLMNIFYENVRRMCGRIYDTFCTFLPQF